MKRKQVCDTLSCFFCRGCAPEWLPLVSVNKQNLEFRKGERIFTEGEPVKGIFFLYQGRVKVHKHWGEDRELIIRFADEGDMLGHRGLGDQLTYPVSATALDPVVICFIETSFFISTVRTNPTLAVNLTMFYSKELQATEERMHALIHLDMKGRIAASLLSLQKQFGSDNKGYLTMTISRRNLASFAGTTYETVFRVLNELIKEKCIAVRNKDIRILDAGRLKKLTKA